MKIELEFPAAPSSAVAVASADDDGMQLIHDMHACIALRPISRPSLNQLFDQVGVISRPSIRVNQPGGPAL